MVPRSRRTKRVKMMLNPLVENIDAWVRSSHSVLTLLGLSTYVVELVVGITVCALQWDEPMNRVIRHYVALRLLSYAYLIYTSLRLYVDYEPAHPGLHLSQTCVWSVCCITLTCASQHRLKTGMSIFMVSTMVADNAVLLGTWARLSYCARVVRKLIEIGEIEDLHKLTYRYLWLIPPAEAEEETARHLLWDTVTNFEDLRFHLDQIPRRVTNTP